MVYGSCTSVDNRLLLRPDTILIDLLDKRHDELGLNYDRIILAITIDHIHGVEPIATASRYADNRAHIRSHCLYKWRILALRITDQDIVISVEAQCREQFLCSKGLPRTRNPQQKCRLIQQILFWATFLVDRIIQVV